MKIIIQKIDHCTGCSFCWAGVQCVAANKVFTDEEDQIAVTSVQAWCPLPDEKECLTRKERDMKCSSCKHCIKTQEYKSKVQNMRLCWNPNSCRYGQWMKHPENVQACKQGELAGINLPER